MVVTRRTLGKIEKSRGFTEYSATNRINTENMIFMANRISIRKGGSGNTMIPRMPINATARELSGLIILNFGVEPAIVAMDAV